MEKVKLVFLLLALSISSLAQERDYCDSLDFDAQYINPIFQKHIDSFVAEAKKRNIDVNLTHMKVCVNCEIHAYPLYFYYYDGFAYKNFKRIDIDTSRVAWKTQAEMLLFHELGHLILKREHLNTINRQGGKILKRARPLSIMNAIALPEFGGNQELRDWYIDELFGIQREIPDKKKKR